MFKSHSNRRFLFSTIPALLDQSPPLRIPCVRNALPSLCVDYCSQALRDAGTCVSNETGHASTGLGCHANQALA